MGDRKPGPIPKTGRSQFTVRMPSEHLEHYKREAERQGLPIGDYLAAMLAATHGLPEPDYLARTRESAARKRKPHEGEGHLPLAV